MRLCTVAVFALAMSVAAFAKGSPALIVISGNGLASPVEITDPASLKMFTPWNGQFADWKKDAVAAPACYRRSYEVRFYMRWPGRKSALDRGDLELIYDTRYCFADGLGYVYLPARDERNYAVNVATIIRDGRDGRWSIATPAWDALIRNALALKEQPAQVDMILISGGQLKEPIQVTDTGALADFEPWSAKFVDWQNHRAGDVVCGWEYEVEFFRRGVEKKTPHDVPGYNMTYGLRFCFDKKGGGGWVHLAGGNDRFGPENANNVWDARHAGTWYSTTADWDRWVRSAVRTVVANSR